ncbi:PREDICTED: uncharacterized protein LOC107064424 [Polistes dominula]|uniref:Uncharacterized protein LOC107064424 n=1 Tax=Polistes dominula TaxID=743375 RepID=A0ABM1HXA0_POLDO|nr:PREDICTED: uncharacterized protein LOC107064424 [Polistes dominula]
MQKCIILFVRDYSVFSMLELLKTIRNWYPESNIPIWGGLMDRLNVCQRCFNKTHCTSAAEMVLMFISSPDMKVWNVTLDKTCNSMITIRQKLTTFKEKVELKLYSIALMYFSSRHIDKLDTIQIKAFQEIFPNIILYPIYGDASIGGETWVEIISTTFMEGQNTTFMILTYN